MKRAFFLLFIFSAACALAEAGELPLALDEAVVIALRDNRDVLLKAADVEKAKAKIDEARSGFAPTLSTTASWTDTLSFYAKSLTAVSTQTTLKYYLYKGGKTENSVRQNQAFQDASRALLEKTKLELAFAVRKAYCALLFALDFRRLNRRILLNGEAHLRSAQDRCRKGELSESDLTAVKASLGNMRQAYEASLSQAEAAQNLLRHLLNFDIEVRIAPQDALDFRKEDFSFEEAFLKGLEARPEIRQYKAEAEAKRAAIEVARAEARPGVYASLDYYSRSTTSQTFTPSKAWQDYSVAGLTFSWPLFDGGATKAKVEQAIVDLKAAEVMKEKALRDIAFDIKDAYLALRLALGKIRQAEVELFFYDDTFRAARNRHAGGLISRLDLEDALLKREVAHFNKKEAVYDYVTAKSRFEAAQGGL